MIINRVIIDEFAIFKVIDVILVEVQEDLLQGEVAAIIHLRTGKRRQAQEHLTTATTLYHEMGMTYRLEKAQAEVPALG